jgi:hypothetical protein
MNSPEPDFVIAAAKYFVEKHPRYIVCPENSKILTAEILRLVDEGADPTAVVTYDIAFSNRVADLTLKAEEFGQPKKPEELTMEEIAALTPGEQDRLPSAVLRRFANWELQQRRKKPVIDEDQALLTKLFEENGFAFSAKNVGAISKWMDERGLGYSPANLTQALETNEGKLEPSEAEIEHMPASEYKERIVNPELREWQAKQPKPEPSVPFGVRRTRFLHEQ